jgi:hypothetical protein
MGGRVRNRLHSVKARTALGRAGKSLLSWGKQLRKVLFLSLGHDALWPQKAIAVVIEKKGFTLLQGVRVFSAIRAGTPRSFQFPEDGYPLPEVVAANIRRALDDSAPGPKEVTLVIPRTWTMARGVALPSTVKENLSQAVAFEFDRLTPIVADQALYDFSPVREEAEKVSFLLTACRKDVVLPYVEALAAQNLKVKGVTTALSSMAFACGYLLDKKDAAFLHILPDGFEGAFLVDGALASAFGGPFNGGGAQEKIDQAIEAMENAGASDTDGVPPALGVLSSDPSVTPAMLKGALGSAVSLGEINGKGSWTKAGISASSLAAAGSIFASLWVKARGTNLLSQGNRHRERGPIIPTLLFLIAIAAMVVVRGVMPLSIEERRLEGINRQIGLLKPAVRQVEALKKEIEGREKEMAAMEGFKKGHPMTIDLLREVTRVLPKNAWLTRARITEKTVDLEGYAVSPAEILPKFESSPLFKKVEFASPTFRDTRQGTDRFVIKMEIEQAGKEEESNGRNQIKK